jgi:hypothetical protein
MLGVVILTIILFYLVISEIRSQDCLSGKCENTVDLPSKSDPKDVAVDRTIELLQRSYTSVGWRRGMIVGLVVACIMSLYMHFLGIRLSWKKFILITVIVFIFTYSMYQWFQISYIKPVCWQAENTLVRL